MNHVPGHAPDLAPQELRILVAVEEEGSFTAAAARLGTTQSAVSHAVRACERKLGAVLFDRGRNGARPTDAGARAVAYARRILRLLEAMGPEVRGAGAGDAAGEVAGPLRIAAFRSVAAHLLPPVLARLAARHPGLTPQVRIVREIGRGTAGEVADGRADLGLATLNTDGPPPVPGLVAVRLFEEEYALAHPVGHPAPRGLPLVDWDENCGSYTRSWWDRQDWIPPATINVEDDTVAVSLVSQGLGMAIMPRSALLGAPPGLAVTGLGPQPPRRSVGYVTTPELAGTAPVRALIRELRALALPEGLAAA
ncbi:LysR family transcriptional regulator [Streptomyces sp. CB01881]|uniref:LysR family transcriptional regulator n=1 Tax=Streptomyces sp. CB01881 TaxID=2078691 RepID=UPI000CDC51C0|nr:LysR family transcriptional regulator [Streptomyces sp. CB01881]AUY51250.1 LysR family transcriptional regulator [Streptomyces sp. CB01881]TYC74636.1 LysR family transcriptional regulator [Streptomyces sp. CB01881]